MMDALERIGRRLLMMVGNGRLTAGNDAGVVQRHQVQLGADEVRDNTPRVAEYGFTSMPLPGATAVVVFVGGNRDDGVIIATGDQRYRLTSLVPGEVAIHDDQGQKVHLSRGGIVATSPTKIRLEAPVIEIAAGTDLKFGADGNGEHWRPTTRDSYSIGATGASHPINPPEIP
jgi:phage baseplate assembly protein V